MKVLNLRCAQSHGFEGWFASEDDFQGQLARGLVQCPVCSSAHVEKLPSAPRLNLSSPREAGPESKVDVSMAPELQAQIIQAARTLVANTEDVGERFVNEARKMHYGEIAQRNIRGKASFQEAMELLEEGVDVMPMALPESLKNTLQ
jgi:hypothetical protein